MPIRRLLRIAGSLRRILRINRLRVVLSAAGVALGVASVVILVSLGEGAGAAMRSRIEAMGSNVITVDAGLTGNIPGRKRQTVKTTTLRERDALALAAECPSIAAIAPTQERTTVVRRGDESVTARIIGTTPSYERIRNYALAAGRFLREDDARLSLRVCVIGRKCVDNLFRGSHPVGEVILIDRIPFEIVGVLKAKGASYDGANEDDVVFIPLTTGMRRVFNVDYIKNMYVQTANRESMPRVEREIRRILRERHRLDARGKDDDFTIQNVYTAVRVESETSRSLFILIAGVAGLSLIVGGLGILAVMLLSVRERKAEIGLRMAVGARSRDVVIQFLLEAVLLSLTGGAAGILAGAAGSWILRWSTGFAVRFPAAVACGACALSCLIGIVFGAYPAWRAAAIEPVKALKG